MNKQNISKVLAKYGLYKPIRNVYNFIGRFNKQTEIIFANTKVKFLTPTYYLNDYINNYAGEEKYIQEFIARTDGQSTIWDIGANIGFYSIIASLIKGKECKIFAFEPDSKTFELLKSNIELNKVENITALSVAIADVNGETILYPSDTPNIGAHSLVQRTDYKVKKRGNRVEVYTADSLIDTLKVDVPDIIKIDVEGAEILVLRGMKNLLTNYKLKTVFCEVHNNLLPLFHSTEKEVIDIFEKECFKVDMKLVRNNQTQYIFSRQ